MTDLADARARIVPPELCGCVDRINAVLAKHFAKLDLLTGGPRVPLVCATVTPNRVLRNGAIQAMKPRSTFIVPNYCPFCGVKLATDDE